ncbi:hypothetical protein CV102_17615 [Natronococcus pandeyae]|uniref:Uncharacterized protein n=1 Tax=Natronococcus pandeyae TaxID=2055836 RepID=A0A8J8Q0Y8_9EURY|nr:hypothetical protein [Natronococcus pandeyae]TYL37426.1 hypothetical protein CV102_17615 [Natronococcus pandeyae]
MTRPADGSLITIGSYAETHQQIWSQLETIHDRFSATDRNGKIAYLKLSYINAVISIRTPVDTHEEALQRFMTGSDLETAMESVNYHPRKRESIRQMINGTDVWHDISSVLETSDLYTVHEIALNRLKFVGTVKVPFLFAKLGYTQKMCIDGNEANLLGTDRSPQMNDIDRYEQLCQKIRDEFPVLSDELEPFHLHWVIFDRQRYPDTTGSQNGSRQSEPVTHHDAWFDAALRDESEIRQRMETIA